MSWTYQYLVTYNSGNSRVGRGMKETPEGAMVQLSSILPKGAELACVTGISLQIAPHTADTVVEAKPAHDPPSETELEAFEQALAHTGEGE